MPTLSEVESLQNVVTLFWEYSVFTDQRRSDTTNFDCSGPSSHIRELSSYAKCFLLL